MNHNHLKYLLYDKNNHVYKILWHSWDFQDKIKYISHNIYLYISMFS